MALFEGLDGDGSFRSARRARKKRQKHLVDNLPIAERRVVIEQLVKPPVFLDLDAVSDKFAVEQSSGLHRRTGEVAVGLIAVGLAETRQQQVQWLEFLATQ